MVQLTLSDISKELNENVVEKAFRKKTNSLDKVVNIEVSRAAPAGEGLISAVYRLWVTGTQHVTSFVAKGLVKDPLLRNSVPCVSYFQREFFFFSKILPSLIEVQEQTGAQERFQNSIPICYHCFSNGNDDYILMEDLSEYGFKAFPEIPSKRDVGICLTVLAHLHATSIALKLKKPDVFNALTANLSEVYFKASSRQWFRLYLQRAIKMDEEVLKKSKDIPCEYYEKFQRFTQEDLYGILVELTQPKGAMPVFNHGDAWYCNFLASKERAVTFDFQVLRYASPVTDLTYFIFLCSEVSSTKELFQECVDMYYNSLQYYLEDMSIDVEAVYSRSTLWVEILKYGKFGLVASLSSIALMSSPRCDVMQSFSSKYSGKSAIPLEELWLLKPIENIIYKRKLINAVRVAIDVGLM